MSGYPDPPASTASIPRSTAPSATVQPAECRDTLERLTERSLAARTPDGHWAGELSSSALATATAATALAAAGRGRPRRALDELVRNGLAWLVATQNADGGWGDTTDSPSNVSTTALVWAALTIAGNGEAAHRCRDSVIMTSFALWQVPLSEARLPRAWRASAPPRA